jgi:hypothetical protein
MLKTDWTKAKLEHFIKILLYFFHYYLTTDIIFRPSKTHYSLCMFDVRREVLLLLPETPATNKSPIEMKDTYRSGYIPSKCMTYSSTRQNIFLIYTTKANITNLMQILLLTDSSFQNEESNIQLLSGL